MVLDDVGKMLVIGRPSILQSLLEMSKIFMKSDNHDILNTLYMTDMKVWLESLNEHKRIIARVAYEYQRILTKFDASADAKDTIGFPLSELEAAVQQSVTRGNNSLSLLMSTQEKAGGGEPPLPLQVVSLKLDWNLLRGE